MQPRLLTKIFALRRSCCNRILCFGRNWKARSYRKVEENQIVGGLNLIAKVRGRVIQESSLRLQRVGIGLHLRHGSTQPVRLTEQDDDRSFCQLLSSSCSDKALLTLIHDPCNSWFRGNTVSPIFHHALNIINPWHVQLVTQHWSRYVMRVACCYTCIIQLCNGQEPSTTPSTRVFLAMPSAIPCIPDRNLHILSYIHCN